MSEYNRKTREILFPEGDIRTDSLLYREKCQLLIPEPYTQNLFHAITNDVQTRFFISSDSERNLERMETFFSRLYGAIFEDADSILPCFDHSIMLRNSILNFRKKEFYHPRFVRNILDFPSFERSDPISYSVTMRSGHKQKSGTNRFNISVQIGFKSSESLNRFRDVVDAEVRDLKYHTRHRLKVSKNSKMRDNLLVQPFNLINFIRIPSERDLVV